jgi:hypothetical protein
MATPPQRPPLRLFLDTGVLIDGFFNRWGTCKAVLILATLRAQFRAVMADPVGEELARAVKSKGARLSADEAKVVDEGIARWFSIARPERVPWPSAGDMLAHADLLSAVRHEKDMSAVVAAVLARPDWVLSTNTAHWNEELATRTGLRIATPADFLSSLRP